MYRDTKKIMSSIDENFSFPALAAVLITMTVEFRVGYRLAFDMNMTHGSFLALLISGMHCLSIQLLVMVPASVTNEKDKSVAQYLLHRIPRKEKDLRFEFETDFKQKKCLTLWKMYDLNRSLIITSLGSLLTYGILIGTLGKK
ncbi:hypothetical protein AVEN_269536-1 [Araneus ventricosus]|uniref:Uncharacterized protein n=1 Tax=Araneus ventricosus TaxID=182803 RepID=A0A4Y2CC42_ARAVE|nr:hypothetical protein AVEN_269536-1 [Araneus ventricosus]